MPTDKLIDMLLFFSLDGEVDREMHEAAGNIIMYPKSSNPKGISSDYNF